MWLLSGLFSPSFKLPPELADSKIYKQSGNSVFVLVVTRIADEIFKVLEHFDKKALKKK